MKKVSSFYDSRQSGILLLCIVASNFLFNTPAAAVQAIPHPVEITQPDGSILTLRLFGDENGIVTTTLDSFQIKQDENGFYRYVVPQTNGSGKLSSFVARNPSNRSVQEKRFLKNTPSLGQTPIQRSYSRFFLKRNEPTALRQKPVMQATPMHVSNVSAFSFSDNLMNNAPRFGNIRSLVILANFKDLAFTNSNSAIWAQLNQKGYAKNGHVGSAKDYFKSNSDSLFSPDFTVVGPVTLSRNQAYYGMNSSDGNDMHAEQMIQEACILAKDSIDYADYDANNDGYVDNVYVIYAGKGEADGGGSNTIAPHSFKLHYSRQDTLLDGKRIDMYSCSNEINSVTKTLNGIGTFTHEYGHMLGLPDMYDVDYSTYNGSGFDLNNWSLMASGSYNNNSSTPPCLTLVERTLLGWTQPSVPDSGLVELSDLESSNQGFVIPANREGEFFFVENRQNRLNTWDAFIPYHGLLIYHVDMRSQDSTILNVYGETYKVSFQECWVNNLVNVSASHQCCDLEEADNYQTKTASGTQNWGIEGDPFPGKSSNTTFNDWSKPASKNLNGTLEMYPITGIQESNGIVRFQVKYYDDFKQAPTILPPTNIQPYSFQAKWNRIQNAAGYELSVYTRSNLLDSTTQVVLPDFNQRIVSDTTYRIQVLNDLTTYFYTVKAINPLINSPTSALAQLHLPDAKIIILPPNQLKAFSFRANWMPASYATFYYLDVFQIDPLHGDTSYLVGFKNKVVNESSFLLSNLEDDSTYYYRVRGSNGTSTSRNSNIVAVSTIRADKVSCYVSGNSVILKGMDKGGLVTFRNLNGNIVQQVRASRITPVDPGFYIVSAPYKGKLYHFKIVVS